MEKWKEDWNEGEEERRKDEDDKMKGWMMGMMGKGNRCIKKRGRKDNGGGERRVG